MAEEVFVIALSHGSTACSQGEAGGWYAFSEETYPLATGRAPMAQCYDKDFFRHGQALMSRIISRGVSLESSEVDDPAILGICGRMVRGPVRE
jgi:hypothetical protein